MLKFVVVEDDKNEAVELKNMIEYYAKENELQVMIDIFHDPVLFLSDYSAKYDLIFMDIQLPNMDGLKLAEKLRRIDSVTMLIFVTNMAYLAGRGYDVNAFDFFVKPLNYEYFSMKMKRVTENLFHKQEKKIIINSEGTKFCLDVVSIIYIEVMDHRLIYHTESRDYTSYSTMKNAQELLKHSNFVLCNSCYLVNLRFVKSVRQQMVTVGSTDLKISRPKKKTFLEALNKYIGGGSIIS